MTLRFVACLALLLTAATPVPAADEGETLFNAHCADCHSGRLSKAPPRSMLAIMAPDSILRAMNSGVMQAQARDLSSEQREVLAQHLTGRSLAEAVAESPAPLCEDSRFDFTAHPPLQGWGVDLRNQRYFPEALAGLNAGDFATLELKWVFAFPGAQRARSQPAFAGGALYVGSQDGTVYALDARSGCVRWRFTTVAEVRTAVVVADWDAGSKDHPLLYFGDLVGNVYALDAVTGELAWRDRPDAHPSLTLTAAPALHAGRLYVPLSSLEVTEAADPNYACCSFRGGVAVYDAATGEKLHVAYTIDRSAREVGKNAVGTPVLAPSGAPVWNTPAIDAKRGVMYVGTGENYSSPANTTSDAVLALGLEDGDIVWQQQATAGDAWNMGCETEARINCPSEDGPDYDFGAATILATTASGRDLVLAGQKSGEVFALDPDRDGAIVWRRKLGRGGIQGGVHFGMAVAGDTLYVPMSDFDGGARWPGEPHPGMFALDINDGSVRWYQRAADTCGDRAFCQPGLSAAASAIEGGVVAGAMDGTLRLYRQGDGEVVWSFDATRAFPALGGQTGQGGSFGGGAGPVFHKGMMYVTAGYGLYHHMPGNVLLAFGKAERAGGDSPPAAPGPAAP